MYYSVLIETSDFLGGITLLNQTDKEKIKERNVIPYLKNEKFTLDGYVIKPSKVSYFKIVRHKETIEKILAFHTFGENAKYNESDIIRKSDFVEDITEDVFSDVTKTNFSILNNKKFIYNKKVFIVHGHDDKIKLDVSNFLRKLGLEPVILHEQANKGKTIIEKIEDNTNVGYGIILYTPCDKGGTADTDLEKMKFRARQNVVFEHGYLIGKLGRNRVCALVNGDIERPSDIDGVLYVPYQNGWELTVGKELRSVGYNVDLNNL